MLLIFVVFSTIFLQGLILIRLVLSLGLRLILLIFTEHHKLFNACLFYLAAGVY